MTATDLRITARFLQPYSHGRDDHGGPAWPPSPLRLFQALVAAAMRRALGAPEARPPLVAALQWLERQAPPEIIAPTAVAAVAPYRLFVPDNVADQVAKSWAMGREASLAEYRSEKDVQPMQLAGEAVHYVFRDAEGAGPHLTALQAAARSMTHLGWGIDMVVGDASDAVGEGEAGSERWLPDQPGGHDLRCAIAGTLAALEAKHAQFLHRLDGGTLQPVSPLTAYAIRPYARVGDAEPHAFAAFRLLDPDATRRLALEAPRRARDVAAWVRHAVAEVSEGWPFGPTGRVVHGHAVDDASTSQRLSFLPLPTITPLRVEGIARVLVAASPGLEPELRWIQARLGGHALIWHARTVGVLEPLPAHDAVVQRYVARSACWSTVTPVVLPGHHDDSARKAERLLRRSFLHAGFAPEIVDAIEDLAWHRIGFRPGLAPADHYAPPDKVRGPMFHVRVRFAKPCFGPIAIGAGRHRGLGIFASE